MAVGYMIATVVRVVVDFVLHKCRQMETLWKRGTRLISWYVGIWSHRSLGARGDVDIKVCGLFVN